MDKPERLAYSEQATFAISRNGVLIPIVVIPLGFFLVLLATDASPTDLVVPCIGTGALGLLWPAIQAVVALGHRMGESRAINRLFDSEIWECWQFSSIEWQALVEAECNLISPREEGLKAYEGAVYSSIFGIILAVILLAVALLAIEDPVIKTMMVIGAPALFLLLLGIGIFQPLWARWNADQYRRRCLQVAEPRVWFAAEGIYHEALGYTSLEELEKVTDQTKSRKAISFRISYSTESSIESVSLPFPVPSGCEERAGILARQYRQYLLQD